MATKVYIAPSADVIGNVTLGEGVNIWYNAVVRADREPITIGARSNVQDGSVVHVDAGYPVVIGEDVTIGHAAIIHGCEIGSGSLIGMGATILNGVKIGKDCMIGAGALVTQGTEIPDGHLAFGNPAKIRRPLTEEEIAANHQNTAEYVVEGEESLPMVEV